MNVEGYTNVLSWGLRKNQFNVPTAQILYVDGTSKYPIQLLYKEFKTSHNKITIKSQLSKNGHNNFNVLLREISVKLCKKHLIEFYKTKVLK